MDFVISYSCGKDSALALHTMIQQGHRPVAMLVMCNTGQQRSWFHGVDFPLLQQLSRCLQIPLLTGDSQGEDYHLVMEQQLVKAAELGAECCVFGDIDIQEHKEWCTKRCENTGLQAVFPLWNIPRQKVVQQFVSLGYTALLKCINNTLLPESMLGKPLDHTTIQQMEDLGVDICGEQGEFHTLVVDGPIFKHPARVEIGKVVRFGTTSAVDIRLK